MSLVSNASIIDDKANYKRRLERCIRQNDLSPRIKSLPRPICKKFSPLARNFFISWDDLIIFIQGMWLRHHFFYQSLIFLCSIKKLNWSLWPMALFVEMKGIVAFLQYNQKRIFGGPKSYLTAKNKLFWSTSDPHYLWQICSVKVKQITNPWESSVWIQNIIIV